jgi:hypothetical protein
LAKTRTAWLPTKPEPPKMVTRPRMPFRASKGNDRRFRWSFG